MAIPKKNLPKQDWERRCNNETHTTLYIGIFPSGSSSLYLTTYIRLYVSHYATIPILLGSFWGIAIPTCFIIIILLHFFFSYLFIFRQPKVTSHITFIAVVLRGLTWRTFRFVRHWHRHCWLKCTRTFILPPPLLWHSVEVSFPVLMMHRLRKIAVTVPTRQQVLNGAF